jgi:D-alanyl-D-alanine carboxypeptidase
MVLAIVLVLTGTVAALAAPKFSAISVDARTGKVLFASDPDGQRYPASLTKVMTLYVLFQDLKAGKITLKTPLKVSARAAGMAPSKLGLKPGSTISVDDAIRALVTKSANDVAAVIGENLGGSEAKFGERMTKVARSIGMSKSTFKNASGLPNPGQVTTARDMATLSLRVQRDFPQYYPYFRIMSFNYKGRVIRTHNRLLGRYEGTDGIKTGYINASGFNLTSSVRRGDKRLVGVVMGAKSAAGRNAYMMSMLDKAFPKAKGGKTIAALAGSSKGAIDPVATTEEPKKRKSIADLIMKPKDKPAAPAETEVAATEEGSTPGEDKQEQGTTFQAVEVPETGEPKVIEAKIGTGADPEPLPFEVKKEAAQADVTASLQPETPAGWNIQVGAFSNKSDAQKTLLNLKKSQPTLKDKVAITVTVQKGNATSYKARFSGFTEADAKDACGKLAKQKVDCLPVSPQS